MANDAPTVYLLDANVFMEAHRRYYAMDICPGFWECLAHHCREPRVFSIDRVKDEINDGDVLAEWVKTSPNELFVSTAEQSVVDMFAEMMTWVQGNAQFRPEAKAEFADIADGWLAAYAKAHGAVLVTHEVYNGEAQRRVPLPNLCRQFDVIYENTFAMLRDLEIRFDWAGG